MKYLIAYIDPGSGSLIFQMLIAGFMSTIFIFKNFFSKIFKSIINLFKKNKINEDK